MLRVVVIGASSKTGETIFRLLRKNKDIELFAFTRNRNFADIFDTKNILSETPLELKAFKKKIFAIKPDIIINTIGINTDKECDSNKVAAWQMNVSAVENLVKTLRFLECKFIQISSDKIFNGMDGPYNESARPDPATYFGKTKLAAENTILSYLQNYAIVRVSLLFGHSSFGKYDFVRSIIQALKSNNKVILSDNYLTNPLITGELAVVIKKIIENNHTGIFNAGSHDIIGLYDFSLLIARVFNLNEKLIVEPEQNNFDTKNRFGLITLKTETNLGIKFSKNTEALSRYKHYYSNNN